MALVGKTAGERRFGKTFAAGDQFSSELDAPLEQVGMRSEPDGLVESPQKLELAEAAEVREIGKRDFRGRVVIDPLSRCFYPHRNWFGVRHLPHHRGQQREQQFLSAEIGAGLVRGHGRKNLSHRCGMRRFPQHGVGKLEIAGPALANIGDDTDDDIRIEIEHLPETAFIADRCTVMHFAGVDGDYVPRPGFHRTASACGFLGSAFDHADPELVMGVAGEMMVGAGDDRLHADHAASKHPKSVSFFCAHRLLAFEPAYSG